MNMRIYRQTGGKTLRRILSLLLAAAMVLPYGLTARAAETGCEHHTEHTPECGYRAATPGAPCKYDGLCDKECADTDGDGQIDHVRDCAYTLTLQKDLCDQDCQDTDGDGFADHGETCAFTQAKGIHEHGEKCGYQEADAGSPCAFQCEACAALTAAPLSEDPPEETTAETTVPETTVPETTVPETTVPETTVSETTVPETTVPETTVPETAVSETTAPVQKVQELIDALPEHVTAENAGDVKAQLTAIDKARTELTDEELDALDITRYIAAVEALSALEGMAEANGIQTLEGTGQYQFDLQFTNVPNTITVKYTVYNENQIVLIEEQTLTVTAGSGNATVYADTLPIKIEIAAENASGGKYSRQDSLYAAGTWTWDFNGGIYPSLSHDHTGETPQWVKEDDTFHILTYPCRRTEGGPEPHEFTNGVCDKCRAEQPVYTVYALLPGTDASSHAACHKGGADTGGLEGGSNYSNLWVFPLPASYQGEIYFQWNDMRFPEGERTLTLDAEQGAWFYDGETGEWSLHSEENHFFLQEGKPCAVCGKTLEYSAYELYAILPDGVTNPRCFAYLNDPSSDASPVLQESMQNMGGYWYCQLTTDQSFMTIAVASEGSTPGRAYYIPGNPDPPPEGIVVPDPSVRKLIYLDNDGIKDHDRYHQAIASFNHYRINGTCIVCGDSLPLAAAVEGKGYTSLEEAWNAACDAYTNKTEKAPVTITLLGDATVAQCLMLSEEKLILEGGEYTVTFNNSAHSIEINDGELTLNSGTIENKQGRAIDLNYGSFVMNGGALKSYNDATVMMGYSGSAPSFTMTGGTIEATGTNNDAIGVAGYRGTVTISGGSVYGQKYAVTCNSNANVTISGGSFRADTNNDTSAAGLYTSSDTVKLSGGTFDRVQCGDKKVADLLAPGYTYYGEDGNEVTNQNVQSLSNVTVKAEATGNLDLQNATTDQSGTGYSWNAATHTLTLQNANIAGDIIFADDQTDITIRVEGNSTVGGDIRIENGNDGSSDAYHITITGPNSLYVAGHLGSDGANGNQITIDTGAVVTAAGGVSASQGGGVDGTLTVRGTLTAIGNSRPAVYIGNVVIDGGTLNVSGAQGVSVGGMPGDNYKNAFDIKSGTFNANCAEYNLVCATPGGEAPGIEPDQVFNIPSSYLPTGYAAQKFNDGAAVAKTEGVTSAYASGGRLTLSANQASGYTVTVRNPTEGGTATASAPTGRENVKITMTATPDSDYHLVGWEVTKADGTPVPTVKNTFLMPASDVTVTPVFAKNGDLGDPDAEVSVKTASRVYNGKAQETTVTVRYNGTALVKGRDYTVTYSGNKDVGKATVTITGTGSYQGGFDAYFDIAPKPVTAVVWAANKDYDGNTNAQVTATVDTGITGETLTVTGLTGTFSDANVGTGKTMIIDATKAKVEGGAGTNPNNYDVHYPTTATADIAPAPMAVTASGYNEIYDTRPHGITVTAPADATVKYGEIEGACTRDRLTYTDAGTYTVYYEVTKVNYKTVTGSETVEITPKSVDNPTVELSPECFTYDGTEKRPTVTVKDGNDVISDREYGVSYRDNKDAGTATVTITDNTDGNYTVNGKAEFTITPASIADASVTVGGTYTYDGTAQIPAVSAITVTLNGRTLTEGADYTYSVENNVSAGTGKVTVTGKGNYQETASGSFTVAKADLTVTAKDQAITYGNAIATDISQVTALDLVSGDILEGVTLTASTQNVPGGTITPSAAVIRNGDRDVSGNYNITYRTGKLNIQKSRPTVAFKASYNPSKTYDGQAIPNPTAEQLTITGAHYEDVVFSWSENPVNAGTYTLTADIPATDNTEEASAVMTVTIDPMQITVRADDLEKVYGDPDPELTYSVSPALVQGDTLTGISLNRDGGDGAGSYPISVSQTGTPNPNYRVTAFHSGTLTVEKREAKLIWSGVQLTYNGKVQAPTAVVGNPVGTDTCVVTVEGGMRNAGTGYQAKAAALGNSNYKLPANASASFDILPKEVQITVTPGGGVYGDTITPATAKLDESDIAPGDTAPTVTLTYAGTANDKTEVNAETPPTLAGAYTVTASIPKGNYVLIGQSSAPFQVRRAESGLTVEKPEQDNWTYGDEDFTLTVTQEGDGALTYSSSDETVVTVDESGKVTIVGAGTAEITVTAAETANYAGGQVKVPVTVEKKLIEITVADQTRIYGDPAGDLLYEITNGSLVEGDTLKLTLTAAGENVGTHPITAPDAAKDNPSYEITVHPGTLTVEPRGITGAKVILGPMLLANGKPQTQTVERVTVENSKGEILDVTYDVTGNTQTAAGAYTMTITGNGNFTGSVTQTFVIAPAAGQPVDTDGSGNIVLGKGKITVLVRQGAGAPALSLHSAKAALAEDLIRIGSLTPQDLAQVAAGAELKIVLDVTNGVSQAEQNQISDYTVRVLGSRARIDSLFDISLYKQLDGTVEWLDRTEEAVRMSVRIPGNCLNTDESITRTFWIVRCHKGTVEFLPTRYDAEIGTLSFSTDRFSGYAIVHRDTKNTGDGQNTATGTSPHTGDSSHIELWITVMALSAVGIGAVMTVKRKKRK